MKMKTFALLLLLAAPAASETVSIAKKFDLASCGTPELVQARSEGQDVLGACRVDLHSSGLKDPDCDVSGFVHTDGGDEVHRVPIVWTVRPSSLKVSLADGPELTELRARYVLRDLTILGSCWDTGLPQWDHVAIGEGARSQAGEVVYGRAKEPSAWLIIGKGRATAYWCPNATPYADVPAVCNGIDVTANIIHALLR
jgi:hypothetical protein